MDVANISTSKNMSNFVEKESLKGSFYDFKLKSIDGETIDFATFKGKKVVVINVASACGYTPQYADWEKFYKANQENVVVLGFPCNQFMGQESKSNAEIKQFCSLKYSVTFPMFEKSDVKGSSKSPLYAWLSNKNQNGWCDKEPTWNFCKYLINERGELVDFFASRIKPDNDEFITALKR
jgi:glutathione peroxidase